MCVCVSVCVRACAYKSQMKGSEDEMSCPRRLKWTHRRIKRTLKSKILVIIDQSNRLAVEAEKLTTEKAFHVALFPLTLLALAHK